MKRINIFNSIFILVLFFGFCRPSFADSNEWEEYKTLRFIIYYKNAPKDFVKTVEESAEEYYRDIARNLGFTRYNNWTWDERAKIYIFDDQEDFVKNGRQFAWASGTAHTKNRIIRTFPSAHGFFDSTLPHEIGHIILREYIGETAEIPLWMEEGIATYQEKAKRWGADDHVREALKNGTFIPLSELTYASIVRANDRKVIELFYNESASVVSYMIQHLGEHRFKRFLRELGRAGRNFERTLDRVYSRFKNIDDLNDSWVDYLERQ